ncbi:hypothetical protein LEN26_005625 [Aphanomyces euteiches]|nr:hypothetical protein LEN26_005625 [Aphanomyces euteiches]KAH9190533.1 hypothetical protein AeNC1_007485 [Aphanomyces euteiches]
MAWDDDILDLDGDNDVVAPSWHLIPVGRRVNPRPATTLCTKTMLLYYDTDHNAFLMREKEDAWKAHKTMEPPSLEESLPVKSSFVKEAFLPTQQPRQKRVHFDDPPQDSSLSTMEIPKCQMKRPSTIKRPSAVRTSIKTTPSSTASHVQSEPAMPPLPASNSSEQVKPDNPAAEATSSVVVVKDAITCTEPGKPNNALTVPCEVLECMAHLLTCLDPEGNLNQTSASMVKSAAEGNEVVAVREPSPSCENERAATDSQAVQEILNELVDRVHSTAKPAKDGQDTVPVMVVQDKTRDKAAFKPLASIKAPRKPTEKQRVRPSGCKDVQVEKPPPTLMEIEIVSNEDSVVERLRRDPTITRPLSIQTAYSVSRCTCRETRLDGLHYVNVHCTFTSVEGECWTP